MTFVLHVYWRRHVANFMNQNYWRGGGMVMIPVELMVLLGNLMVGSVVHHTVAHVVGGSCDAYVVH